jgi:excinuclease ABC subunit C
VSPETAAARLPAARPPLLPLSSDSHMTPRADYRTTDIPSSPGVYVFRDRLRKVIYVGKAKSLRKRLSSYFQPSRRRSADPKLRSLVNSIGYYELHPVRTENEAMLLESRLIKQYSPRYNVVLRDDKRFLLLKIDLNTPYPRLQLARLQKDDGCAYYGPFPHAGVLRDTLDYLTRHFGLRSCRQPVPTEQDRKHCLDQVVRFCSAPCVNAVTEAEYRERVDQLIAVVEGKTTDVVAALRERMEAHAEHQRFERAAELRDVIDNINTVFKPQNRTFRRAYVPDFPGAAGVEELQQVLDLEEAPRRIECFDISTMLGQHAVGSMVCFIDGKPANKEYRHFRIRTVEGQDDFAMMAEVVTRRYSRQLEEDNPLPELVVIDGGRGQLNAAYAALEALALESLPLISLAKREEEIYTMYDAEPLALPRQDAALRLLQAIRDEAHRFAITFHQKLRRNRILDSLLDEIPGIGKKRKEQLLREFGSVRNLRRQNAEAIVTRVPGIGSELAAAVVAHLKRK